MQESGREAGDRRRDAAARTTASLLRVLIWSGVALAPASLAHAAAADSAAADASDIASATVQDVIVTATRQETNLQKTPVADTVVQPEQISQQNIVTTRDLAGEIPGVTIQRSGITPTTEIFFIRGIGDSDPIFDPSVAQYVDDVYLPRAINGMTDLTDIERVEVLRGPQGTLFGENAGGGAIRYITRTPTDQPQASFDIGGGSYGAFDIHAYASGPLIAGSLDASIALAHDQHDGYTWDPTLGRSVNNEDTTGGRLKLLATFSPRLTATLSIDGAVDSSGSAYYTPLSPIIGGTLQKPVYGPFQPNVSYASQEPINNSWTAGASVKLAYDLTQELKLNSITAVRGFAQDPINYNNDGQPLVPYSAADLTPVQISDNYIVYREHEVTQELQAQGKYSRLDFTSGLYFLYEDFASNRIGYVVSPVAATALPAYPEDQIGDTKTYNYAVYAQGDYRPTDQLTLTLGGRYTLEHRDFTFRGVYDNFVGLPLPVTPGAPTSTPGGYAAANNFSFIDGKSWTSFTPKVGFSYQFTPDIYGYASISRGFDAGGFNNRASSLATALPYDQETVTTYESGLKSEWFERRLRLNATVFYNQFRGLQETASVVSPITGGYVSVRSNANKAHSDGVEFEAAAAPADGLSLTFNASYLETRFDSFPNAAATVVAGSPVLIAATGNQLPLSPHWQVYGAASYRLPIDVRGDLRIGADATYVSSYFSDVFNYQQGRTADQTFIDAFVSYAPSGSRLLFTLTGRNLADHFYFQSITWGSTPNLWYGPMNPPRTVFFKIAYTL
jgi:iron complex outermembrane receptor protein